MTVFQPQSELMEERLLLSHIPKPLHDLLARPPVAHAVRPNTPVLPFGAVSRNATFIDPSVHIFNGRHIVLGGKTLVAPYATLNATSGFIKIGSGSEIQDNAQINSNPHRSVPTSSVIIGDMVLVGYGATVNGPSVIGAFGSNAKVTAIGSNAVIDGATIQPGALVGALAYVGPGVTVPSGFEVLAGAKVTTNAQASNPALGQVIKTPSGDVSSAAKELTNATALAGGYTTLYQGNSATAASPGVLTAGIFNGNLAAVEGTSAEPGSPAVAFEPAAGLSPTFPAPDGTQLPANIYSFRARVIGQVLFYQDAALVAHHLGFGNSIRADQGQPIIITSINQTGDNVTINSPVGGTLFIGQNFVAGNSAVILSGAGFNAVLGDNVNVGARAVVDRSSIGANSNIGAGAYVATSNLPANSNVAPGSIIINNKFLGFVQP